MARTKTFLASRYKQIMAEVALAAGPSLAVTGTRINPRVTGSGHAFDPDDKERT